ncbi:DUF6454 family protein [Actinopolymorpha sp. B9G3]|uniref:DUF6454 family protein n=1 Tax=Actinopolymorpha sp. B9G3 TaxID=3158970 RepID=UPI0032D8F846
MTSDNAHAVPADDPVTVAFARTTAATRWRLNRSIPLRFPTHHPQGLALIGDTIALSTVEVVEWPVRRPQLADGHDRTPGKGIGHLLLMDRDGNLRADIEIGDGTVYHPGGIDFDGESVWVPVAEYRPDSRAIIYRFDPSTAQVSPAFEIDDHISAVVRDRITGNLHGMSWDARAMYQWTPDGTTLARQANEDHLVAVQDANYVGWRKQICTGVASLPTSDGGRYELGSVVLRDLRDNRILHQIPFPYFSSAGHVMTRNPVALEVVNETLRLLAAPDDGDEGSGTELFVYEALMS